MKNELFKTAIFQNEAILCETNFETKRHNSFHFSTISFNNFQIKLIILVALFIILIFNTNNTYALTDFSQVNYSYLNNLTDEEFIDFIKDFYNYLWNGIRGDYIFVNKTDYQFQFYTSLSPLITRNYNYSSGLALVGSLEGVPSNSFYTLQENYCVYNMTWINSSMIYNNGNSSSQSYHLNNSSILLNNMNNTNIIYSNFDIINIDDNSVYFSKNFDLTQEEGGGDIDMTEVTSAIDTNSNIQVLILFFLISLFVYLIFYTVANSGRRNK